MDYKTKNAIFSGNELDKLKDFCKNCAEEDKKIHEQRKIDADYVVPEPEEPKPSPQPPKAQSYQPPTQDSNQYQYNQNEDIQHIDYKDSVKTNVIGENDPDPFNARIKFDTFDERLKQFGGNKK